MLEDRRQRTRISSGVCVLADIDREHENLARPWRRTARGDRYAAAAANEDPRTSRDSF